MVIGTDTDRLGIYDFRLVIRSTYGPICYPSNFVTVFRLKIRMRGFMALPDGEKSLTIRNCFDTIRTLDGQTEIVHQYRI